MKFFTYEHRQLIAKQYRELLWKHFEQNNITSDAEKLKYLAFAKMVTEGNEVLQDALEVIIADFQSEVAEKVLLDERY